jgi:hypothetical protein
MLRCHTGHFRFVFIANGCAYIKLSDQSTVPATDMPMTEDYMVEVNCGNYNSNRNANVSGLVAFMFYQRAGQARTADVGKAGVDPEEAEGAAMSLSE